MQKQIGNIIVDYTYYKGQDLYSDGEIEDILLEIVKNKKQKEVLYSSNQWLILYHLSNIRENILEWYPFESNATILEIGSGCGAITELFNKDKIKYIKKEALDEKAIKHILSLKDKEKKWKNQLPNINYVEGFIENNNYITPYIEGIDIDLLFYKDRHNIELFLEKYCYFQENYLKPKEKDLFPFVVSEKFISIFGDKFPSKQMTLSYTNIDLIFSNLKLTSDNQVYCFDYEWVFDFPIPYEYVLWRSATQLYLKYMVYGLFNEIYIKRIFFN